MRILHILLAALLLPTLLMAQTAPVKTLEVKGVIDSVTVYRGQALVARTVDVPAPGGLREVVITDLPVQVVPSSLFAESGAGAVGAVSGTCGVAGRAGGGP